MWCKYCKIDDVKISILTHFVSLFSFSGPSLADMVGFLERSDLCNTFFPRFIHGDLFLFSTERDAFDTLFDHAPDKLSVVKKVLRLCSSIVLCGTMED